VCCSYLNQGRGLSPLPPGNATTPNYSLNHARSGSDNLTASTYPLLYRPRRSGPLRAYLYVIFMGFRGPEALKDNLEQRGDCQATRKSHKTTRIVGWVVGRDSLSTGRDSHKPTHRTISCIQRWLRRSRPQHQLAAGVAQFELSERVAHVVEREDSGNRHFQLTPCDEVGQLGDHLCRCGIRAAF